MTSSPASPTASTTTGYYGNLDAKQQAVLAELKQLLLDKHGITQEAAQIDERFRQKDLADADKRYDLELLCVARKFVIVLPTMLTFYDLQEIPPGKAL